MRMQTMVHKEKNQGDIKHCSGQESDLALRYSSTEDFHQTGDGCINNIEIKAENCARKKVKYT